MRWRGCLRRRPAASIGRGRRRSRCRSARWAAPRITPGRRRGCIAARAGWYRQCARRRRRVRAYAAPALALRDHRAQPQPGGRELHATHGAEVRVDAPDLLGPCRTGQDVVRLDQGGLLQCGSLGKRHGTDEELRGQHLSDHFWFSFEVVEQQTAVRPPRCRNVQFSGSTSRRRYCRW